MVRLRRMAPEVYDPTGLRPIGERPLRCIDPSHSEPCSCCTAPPEQGEDSMWSLRGDPGKRNGDKKLRTLIQMTREWNSPLERSHLVHYLQNHPELRGLNKVIETVRRKETPRLSKMCMLVLARAWGFKSDIWTRKCFAQPYNGGGYAGSVPSGILPSQPSRGTATNGKVGKSEGTSGEIANALDKLVQNHLLARNGSSDYSADCSDANTVKDGNGRLAVPTASVVKTELVGGHQHPSANVLRPAMSPKDVEASDTRNELEREVIAKFTLDLDNINGHVASAVEQMNAMGHVPSSGGPLAGPEAAALEQQRKFCASHVRGTADALRSQVSECEGCLAALHHSQAYSKKVQEQQAWLFPHHLGRVEQFLHALEQILWQGLLQNRPEDQYTLPGNGKARAVALDFARFQQAALLLCARGRCETAMARTGTFAGYAPVAMGTLKVCYVLIMEVIQKIAELRTGAMGLTAEPAKPVPAASLKPLSAAPVAFASATPPQASLPASHDSSQLIAPVIDAHALAGIGLRGVAPQADPASKQCLKLLRNLSSEIVMPRSISSEILIPLGMLDAIAHPKPTP